MDLHSEALALSSTAAPACDESAGSRDMPGAASRSVIVVIVAPDQPRSAAVRRGAEMARRAGGKLHLCAFVFDAAVAAAGETTRVGQLARRALLSDAETRLRALAKEYAHDDFSIEYEVLWAPVVHEAVLVEQQRLGADLVIKDVPREPVLRRALMSPLDWQLIRLLPCELMLVGPRAPASPRRVLAAVDVLADGEQALNDGILAAAVRVAELGGSRLDLASVAPSFPARGRIALASSREQDEQFSRHLEAFRRFASHAGVPCERRHRLLGAPDEAISRLAEELAADVTVVGSTHRTLWERLLLGSTAESLLRQLRSDLLVVKPGRYAEATQRQFDFAAAARRLDAAQPRQDSETLA